MVAGDGAEQNEAIVDELDLARVIGGYRLALGRYYFGVNLIPRNLKVSPDIDLLNVYVNEYRPDENTAVGFELKVLKYHRGRRRVKLAPFYQGIGQVLTYFQHGIDRAMLMVGFGSNCREQPEATQYAKDLMKTHSDLLKESALAAFPYLQVASFEFGNLEMLLHVPEWDKQRFHHRTEEAKLRRASLFKGQFSYKKLLSK